MQTISSDYIIVGAGVGGFSCALEASKSGTVALISKTKLPNGNTMLAQGGIAVAMSQADSPELHIHDTLQAGAGICKEEAVDILIREGIDRVQQVIDWGFPYDKGSNNEPVFGREGAHSIPRVMSANGDGSGKALAETLYARVRQNENIQIYEGFYVLDLLISDKKCTGMLAVDLDTDKTVAFLSRAVVLASGGCGQIYSYTTNDLNCTGDGIAIAYRAGAVLENMEFIQFHPTALNLNENPMFLISEAVRGEGAILVNSSGEKFMSRYHPWQELAPRDVVARAIYNELTLGQKVYLDVSLIGEEFSKRFPSIYSACKERNLDPTGDLIPVVPAMHFIMGGVKTDLYGRTNITGLYACGEVACTGVHGANRLASNSLLEGLVFGNRVGRALSTDELIMNNTCAGLLKTLSEQGYDFSWNFNVHDSNDILKELRKLMWDNAGLVRSKQGLYDADCHLLELEKKIEPRDITLINMITVSKQIVESALNRQASLGSHYRADFGDKSYLPDACSF